MENLPKKVRSKKLNSRVDLTAMVSISFLLIIFFMVTRELAKPKGIELGLPNNDIDCGPIGCINGGRIYTILLDDDNKIITYQGLLDDPLEEPKNIPYGKNGIRKELLNIKSEVSKYTGNPNKGLIVIIKPSKKSNKSILMLL